MNVTVFFKNVSVSEMCFKDHLPQDMLCGGKKIKDQEVWENEYQYSKRLQLPNPMDIHNLLAHERL